MPASDWETIQSVDPSAIRLGSDFGPRYRIEALLGQGGMGRVYKAYDKELNRTVAIKVVRHGVMGEQAALSRFKQELVLASKISHKNILRIHDLGEVNGMKFISMAYIEARISTRSSETTQGCPWSASSASQGSSQALWPQRTLKMSSTAI